MKKNELTNQYYYGTDQFLVAVDCMIFGFDLRDEKLKVLLFKRLVEPFYGEWSLIGSFVRSDEGLDDAAKRVLLELTGLKTVFLEQYKSYGQIDRDPGARVISTTFWSLIKIEELDLGLIESHGAKWFTFDEVPHLVLDHKKMLKDVKTLLTKKVRYQPLVFELLPEKFTMPQLFKLYQEIYQRSLDDRNFRKKIISTRLLLRLEEKDKGSSRKGAYLYQLNRERYDELIEDGFDFDL